MNPKKELLWSRWVSYGQLSATASAPHSSSAGLAIIGVGEWSSARRGALQGTSLAAAQNRGRGRVEAKLVALGVVVSAMVRKHGVSDPGTAAKEKTHTYTTPKEGIPKAPIYTDIGPRQVRRLRQVVATTSRPHLIRQELLAICPYALFEPFVRPLART